MYAEEVDHDHLRTVTKPVSWNSCFTPQLAYVVIQKKRVCLLELSSVPLPSRDATSLDFQYCNVVSMEHLHAVIDSFPRLTLMTFYQCSMDEKMMGLGSQWTLTRNHFDQPWYLTLDQGKYTHGMSDSTPLSFFSLFSENTSKIDLHNFGHRRYLPLPTSLQTPRVEIVHGALLVPLQALTRMSTVDIISCYESELRIEAAPESLDMLRKHWRVVSQGVEIPLLTGGAYSSHLSVCLQRR